MVRFVIVTSVLTNFSIESLHAAATQDQSPFVQSHITEPARILTALHAQFEARPRLDTLHSLLIAAHAEGELDRVSIKVTKILRNLNAQLPIHRRYVDALAKLGRLDLACKVAGDYLQAFPDRLEWRFTRAKYAMWRGDFEAAQTDFREVLQQDPRNSSAFSGLAQIAFQSGEPVLSREYYARAKISQPDDEHVQRSLWAIDGNIQMALDHAAARLEPPELYSEFGRLYRLSGQHDLASEAWQRYLTLAPEDQGARRDWVLALSAANRHADAAHAVESMVLMNPHDRHQLLLRAQVYAGSDAPLAAMPYLDELARLYPREWRVRLACGLAFLRAGRYVDASREFAETLLIYPQAEAAWRGIEEAGEKLASASSSD